MGGLTVKATSTPLTPAASSEKEKSQAAPRRKTRWWTWVALAACLAAAFPLYQYNLSNWRLQSALGSLENGEPEAAIALLEIEQKAHPQSAELAYWMAVAQRRAGHLSVFQDHLQRAKDLGYSIDELHRQFLLMRLQAGTVSPEVEHAAEQLVENAEKYAGPRVDLYIDEFYEARSRGYLVNYRLFDAEVTLDHWVQARPQSILAHMMRADIREREFNLQSAEREYRDVLALAPENVTARLKRARLLMHNLKISEAAEEFRVCLKTAPQNITAQIGLAECEYRSGTGVDAAQHRLEQVLTQDLTKQERARSLFLLGEIVRGKKQNDKAIEYLTSALKLESTMDPGPYRWLSGAYAAIGKREEAAKYLKISQEKMARFEQMHLVADKVAQAPEDPDLRFQQGNIQADEGQMDEAVGWWNMAIRFDPKHLGAHEALAKYYGEKGDRERAEHHQKQAELSAESAFNNLWLDLLDSNTKSVREGLPRLARYPALGDAVELLTLSLNIVERKDIERSAQGLGRLTNNPRLRLRALTMLAEALSLMGHLSAAERAYQEVLTMSPNNVVAHRGLQGIYFDLGAYDQMELHAHEVAKIDPTDYRAHRHLAFVRREAETWDAAIADYKESLRRNANQPTRQQVLLEMADCYIHALKYQEALDILKDARPSAQKSFHEAQCKFATKKVPEAKKLLDEALKTDPDHAPSLMLRADVALVDDDVPAAREFLDRAVKAAPFDNTAHQKLSTVLLRLEEKELAKKESELAKELLDKNLRFSELNNQAAQRPRDIEVRKEMATLAKQLGRDDEAKRWERVVDGMSAELPPAIEGPSAFPREKKPFIGPLPKPKPTVPKPSVPQPGTKDGLQKIK
jgi:tetratricopeptide (TPR) repeat protein